MLRNIMCFLVLLTFLSINAQTINLHGKVTNNADKPIVGATVTLVGQNLKATTGADGSYSITGTNISRTPELIPQSKVLSLDKGSIELSLPVPSMVKIEFFDLKGKLIAKEPEQYVSAGFYHFNIKENIHVSKLFIVRVTIGQDEVTFRYLPLNSEKFTVYSNSRFSAAGKLAKIAAINDTLKITATGYNDKKLAITSYDQELNIKLDTLGETVGRSAGCGKSTTLKGEKTLEITTGGKKRTYILRLPDDYNPDKAYRLIFSIHC
ncbi:MAG TPA: carboxypeptidase-like regulatory domain-containing protein, partial [Chitinispirillaceae bacterium]|nr:carboxypeptidase-like regulatory domain-containing protein [Chitinispirillaceae bacterium]